MVKEIEELVGTATQQLDVIQYQGGGPGLGTWATGCLCVVLSSVCDTPHLIPGCVTLRRSLPRL